MTLIIGFGNKARHGKDTAAEAIVEFYADQRRLAMTHGLLSKAPVVRQFGFAEALYQECRALHGMKDKDAPLLQKVGAQRRAEDPNYWVKQVFNKITPAIDIAIISDVRYQNEADAIKQAGGSLVNVTRLYSSGRPFVADDRPANHPSETELDGYNWDYFIKAKSGDAALVGEQAITIAEFIRGLNA